MRRTRRSIVIGVLALAAMACTCGTCSGLSLVNGTPAPSGGRVEPALAPSEVGPTPTLNTTPASPAALGVLDQLRLAELPIRDRFELATRLRGLAAVPTALATPTSYQLGDVEEFWAENSSTDEVFRVTAELRYITPHAYMWVEQGWEVDDEALAEAAERFETHTYPTDRLYFGSEWSPGIDGDIRVHILHTGVIGDRVAGYFYSPSEYPAEVVSYSNQKEMFYINISNTRPDSPDYDGVLAHEFQHMIHWHVDRNEDIWLNEGLSELAILLNGYPTPGDYTYFVANPDHHLTGWPEGDVEKGAYYGAAFLFAAYFLERFGEEGVSALVADQYNGMIGVEHTLAQISRERGIEPPISVEDFFGDWAIANFLNDPGVGDGRYYYSRLPDIVTAQPAAEYNTYPADGAARVNQYGMDYIQLYGTGEVTLAFEGSRQVRILPTSTENTDGNPSTDDAYVWWSNRGDDSDTTLTARFDLSGVTEAALDYDVWYFTEEGWDYGYVEVSEDGGQTWQILSTPHTTTYDPHGNAYGTGYTGRSEVHADANPDGWLHETVDLTPYVGGEVMIRFEVITDDAVNQPGVAVDNVCIHAIGFCDDAETGDGSWKVRGFVRHANALPQVFLVQAIVPRPDRSPPVVERLSLDQDNRGEWNFTFHNPARPITLVVSGLTPFTGEQASYTYRFTPAGQQAEATRDRLSNPDQPD
jgi:immune inhibitor A